MPHETKDLAVGWPPKLSRTAPKPRGWVSGQRHAFRRWASIATAAINRALDRLPPGRWMHRWVQRGLEFTDVRVDLRRSAPGLDGLKIAFLSDIHAGSYMDQEDLCRIFRSVAAQNPDLICFGGDLINTREREILMFREAVRYVDPPLGVFAVPGNHDHFWGKDLGMWTPFLNDIGVRVLNNEGIRIHRGGSELWLAGVDDLTEGEPDLALALEGSRPEEPIVLLAHHPDFFFEAAAVGVDLTLSGHTHGGQIKVFGKAPVVHSHFGYLEGMFGEGDSLLYVSRGAGLTLLPVRIGAPAEIPMVTLRSPCHERR